MKKLVATSQGEMYVDLTKEELAQQVLIGQLSEQQAQLSLLLPTQDEISQAEFELKTITLLQEVGLL